MGMAIKMTSGIVLANVLWDIQENIFNKCFYTRDWFLKAKITLEKIWCYIILYS